MKKKLLSNFDKPEQGMKDVFYSGVSDKQIVGRQQRMSRVFQYGKHLSPVVLTHTLSKFTLQAAHTLSNFTLALRF